MEEKCLIEHLISAPLCRAGRATPAAFWAQRGRTAPPHPGDGTRVSEGNEEAEGQRYHQEQGPGRGWQGLPIDAFPDPVTVGGDL